MSPTSAVGRGSSRSCVFSSPSPTRADPMTLRDRTWLQGFLTLGALRSQGNISPSDIERQEDTVLRALEILDQNPGVVLADEVGMGKTFEALGVLAARAHLEPESRFLVVTPGPDLNKKWTKEIDRFTSVVGGKTVFRGLPSGSIRAVGKLGELLAEAPRRRVLIAPISILLRGVRDDQFDLLDLFCRWKRLSGPTRAAIFRRFRDGACQRAPAEVFIGGLRYTDLEAHLEFVFARADGREPTLDAVYGERGNELFADEDVACNLLDLARYRLARAMLPTFDLLVVDEAHKLKNRETKRFVSLSQALRQRFRHALFLTATPFQLGPEELRQVFTLFGLAQTAPADLGERAEALLGDIRDYQAAYVAFERDWSRVDPMLAGELASHLGDDPELASQPTSPALRPIVAHLRRLFELKDRRIEPEFRRWMVRSRRDDRFTYRLHTEQRLPVAGAAMVPFLAYERLIAELFHQNERTHKAAVEINMVSSYGAARASEMLTSEKSAPVTAVEQYRVLLREILGALSDEHDSHPKLSYVMSDVLRAAEEQGEKTLIFCARIETLHELQRRLRDAWEDRLLHRWRKVFTDASHEDIFGARGEDRHQRGRHAQIQQRFHRTQDLLYFGLRERYLQTLLHFDDWAELHLDAILERAHDLLRQVRTGQTSAERVNFCVLKRVVERAAVELRREREPAWADEFAEIVGRLCDPRYIALGYDLVKDELEEAEDGPFTPTWQISREHAQLVVSPRPHLWTFFRGSMFGLPDERRVQLVERIARYLTARSVPFVADALAHGRGGGLEIEPISSRALLDHVDEFWQTPVGHGYIERIREFLRYFHYELTEERQDELLDGSLLEGRFVSQTRDGESRERLREAFNTPLYPMVLIANEVMQEGLDLQRSCCRVIHHDLPWNPAQLEQRVGRVDRLGGRIHKLRDRNSDAKLEILYPLIQQTIDMRIHQTIRQREKWLEFLLGAPPDVQEYGANEIPPPLPPGLADRLRIDLRPRISSETRS
ncbi:SNF2-related protein [Nannocystis sp. SCPEA4]|uniref:SNF2-related protein n=1 Tax=Nannocystis sp. SCPEA4 TaxID=2996787 RepID=UPI002271E15F|nr:SNF2-related protein [Nannocystis sp. SCPEA4]MCY1061837.1 helicase-related protein [Nannocystis sp. SCPEA4]